MLFLLLLAMLVLYYRYLLIFNFPLRLLPQEAKEGTVLNINIDIDQEETKRRKDKIQNLLNKLKERDKGGDIQL